LEAVHVYIVIHCMNKNMICYNSVENDILYTISKDDLFLVDVFSGRFIKFVCAPFMKYIKWLHNGETIFVHFSIISQDSRIYFSEI
jgi:hypothetical protein